MNEKTIEQARHYGRLAFMVLVTAWLVGAACSQAAKGGTAIASAVAFAFAAGFGLEFVTAVWTGRTRPDAARSSVRR